MKTNWSAQLKTVLEKGSFSEKYANSPLTETDKTNEIEVSSVFVSAELGHIPKKNLTDQTNNIVSSAFVSDNCASTSEKEDNAPLISQRFYDRLPDAPEDFDNLRQLKSEYFTEILSGFIERGVNFNVSDTDFEIIDPNKVLLKSEREFLEINHATLLCHLQQSLLMKNLFTHSPEKLKDFGFEIYEREAAICEGKPISFDVYFEAVAQITRQWFAELLEF